VTLAQLPPAATPAIRQSHRLLLLGPSAPSSPPWLATAGPAPPPAARCRAPDTAGQRGCRTAARSCGRPGSASRRSAGCTDGHCRAWASRCNCGPCRSPNRARWRSPRAGGSSGRSRGVTALGLVARLQPTHRTDGRVRPSRSRVAVPPYSPAGRGSPGTVWVRPATQGRNGRRALRRCASDRPVMSCQARVGRMRPASSSSIGRWGRDLGHAATEANQSTIGAS
jgi:hypothetical protein